MSYPVKLFRSTDLNAPILSGTIGALIPLLDACLITGYNVQAVNKLLIAAGVATVTTNATHGFKIGDVVALSGATDEALNAEFVVTAADNNSFSFKVEGTHTSPATGSISAKKAPAGWSKPFTGTNKAAYKSKNLTGNGFYLSIDDGNARYARVRGYEVMSDVYNGTGLFPTLAQQSSGLTWTKSDAINATAREWVLIADDRFFYFFPQPWAIQGASVCVFGEVATKWAGDAFNTVIQGSTNINQSSAPDGQTTNIVGALTGRYMARAAHGLGSAVTSGLYGAQPQTYPGYGAVFPFPNPSGQVFICSSISIFDADSGMRGLMPGLYQPLHNQPLNHMVTINGLVVDGVSKDVVIVEFAIDSTNRGRLAIGINGAWR